MDTFCSVAQGGLYVTAHVTVEESDANICVSPGHSIYVARMPPPSHARLNLTENPAKIFPMAKYQK